MRASAASLTFLSQAASVACLSGAAAASEITSAYSGLDVASCETLFDSDPPPGQRDLWREVGAVRQVCPGYAGHEVHIISGDALLGVGFAPDTDRNAEFPLELFDTYAVPNRGTVEWRLRDGVPFAVIQRWSIDRGGEPPDYAENGSVLVISKLTGGTPASCVMGHVDAKANADANALARQVADTMADGFTCGVDRPAYAGVIGPTAAPHKRLN